MANGRNGRAKVAKYDADVLTAVVGWFCQEGHDLGNDAECVCRVADAVRTARATLGDAWTELSCDDRYNFMEGFAREPDRVSMRLAGVLIRITGGSTAGR